MGSSRTARRRRPSQAVTMQAGGLAHQDSAGEHQEQAEAAAQAVRDAERQADEGQQREEGMDAQFDAHPTAQRD